MHFHVFLLSSILILLACREIPPTADNKEKTSSPKGAINALDTINTVQEPKIEPIVFDYDTSQWTELIRIDSTIVLDLRYATTNNFVEEVLYDCGRCFLRPEAAQAVVSANKKLKTKGYYLKLFDCFRPLPIQQRLWDKFRNPSYVTPPSKGSMHNRGLAVDLTIVDATGKELEMGTEFDFFGREAHHDYVGHSEAIQQNRILLKTTLESVGFKGIRTEWWHYSFGGTKHALSDMVWECKE